MKQGNKSFADRLRSGELLIGTLVSLNSPEITEILAEAGFDWLFIDAEHGAYNPQQAQSMLQAAGQCPCVIRVPAGDEIWIKKALDTGAAGIIVPQVHTAEQARQIVQYCKYSPEGSRGVGIGRAHKYGLSFEDTIKNANRQTAVILQAESKQAIENIGAIVKVNGIDAIFIGPYDLSASLCRIGKVTDPEVIEAIGKVTSICKKAGVRLGIFGVSADAVKPYIKKGFTLITAGVDTLFVIKSAEEILAECRG
ncbi:MAG: 2,4-dihydroxyhept-2-ene-1,7-dioic acid aldolase [Gammaproteobacteria bacterium]|nr:2,4-dihydroxyhept-2-ene-1,7-dioic acid aldolase [Gammaproteobacteria bacterium]